MSGNETVAGASSADHVSSPGGVPTVCSSLPGGDSSWVLRCKGLWDTGQEESPGQGASGQLCIFERIPVSVKTCHVHCLLGAEKGGRLKRGAGAGDGGLAGWRGSVMCTCSFGVDSQSRACTQVAGLNPSPRGGHQQTCLFHISRILPISLSSPPPHPLTRLLEINGKNILRKGLTTTTLGEGWATQFFSEELEKSVQTSVAGCALRWESFFRPC